MISVCPYLIYDNPLIFLLSYSACFFIWPFPFKHIFVWYFLWKDNYPDICCLHITITIFWQDTQFWGCSYRITSWLRLEANYFTRFTCFTFTPPGYGELCRESKACWKPKCDGLWAWYHVWLQLRHLLALSFLFIAHLINMKKREQLIIDVVLGHCH